MLTFKRLTKQIAGWVAAFLIAAVICDIACFLFDDPCQELPRQHGATTGYLLPDSFGVYGLEGYCIADIDENGYLYIKSCKGHYE